VTSGVSGTHVHLDRRQAAAPDECRIRVAAAGDIHCGDEGDLARWSAAFGALEDRVDVVLLAGDLTTHGEPEQAALVARAAAPLSVPVLTVLGNHDWHANRADEITAALAEGGVEVLDRDHRILGYAAPSSASPA
jgi:predicted MPP superfamily phosphohydrolase